jgi:tetratricopeptide (TPR) repeat protein/tRNA A-37 threonylcarbamoyl transferase component Bud32
MSQPAASSSFVVTCPGCGQRLRFAVTADSPPRLRIQCSSCKTTFGVRRPGTPAADAPSLDATASGAPPVYTGMPTAPSVGADDRTGLLSNTRPRGEDEPALGAGERIAGRYRVIRFLARGGMGEVYEVEDLELRERVALKTIRAEVARDSVTVERFRREIQLARKVTHPNVCRIFDVSFHDGLIFLTMELLEGETLAQRLRRIGPMSPGEALPVARQIADALQAAHQAGIVHRDLKPGNVVLAESRGALRAVVTDFGLARFESGEDVRGMTLTAGAAVVGTPAYLAPEQVEGKEITAAVDLYALGIVLYEMLTGTVPFVGDTALSTAVKRLQEAPPSPRMHVPGLDPRWEAAILRCLERNPAARFASAPEVIRAITGPEIPAPAPAPPAAAPTESVAIPPPQPAPRLPRLQVALLAALVVAALGVGWYRYSAWRAEQEAPIERLSRLTEGIKPRRSVAVLAFKNLSGRPDLDWLSSGLAEMLSTELGSGGRLRIVDGENVARARVELGLAGGGTSSLSRDELARLRAQLGTDDVVLGSYAIVENAGQPGGRQIRLDLHLQDTLAGETTAQVAETGTEAQLFDLVARTGRRLREELGAGASKPAARALPASPEAARLYSQGIEKLRLFEPAAARDLLSQAVAADPGNALAHSALATAWSALGYDAHARDEAKAAFGLSTGLPEEERLLIEGRYRETLQDWNKAVQIYWSLWSMFPDSLDYGLRLAAAQTAAGRAEEALATTEALRQLPPPSRDDPRIDLADALAAGARADFRRQQQAAARAAVRGAAQKSSLMTAQARLLECRALRNLGQAPQALAACAEGQRLYDARGDRAGVAEALTHAANVRFDRGELDAASELYDQALAIWRAIGNRGGEAGALNNIAIVLKSRGDLERARQLYEQVLAIARETGSKAGEAYALNNLAGVLLRRGRLADARTLFEQSLSLRRDQEDRSGEAYALDNLGVVLRRQGSLPEARQKHEMALAIRREIGQRIGEVASLNNLGALQIDQGDLPAARKSYETSLALCRQIGSQSSQAYALFGLGEVLAREGRLDEARQRHEEALAIRTRLGEKGTIAESRLALARLLLDARGPGQAAQAGEQARLAAADLEQQGSSDLAALAHAVAALAAEAQGQAPQARQEMELASGLLKDSQDLRTRLEVQIRTAPLRRPADAEASLTDALGQATRAGFFELRLEASLALADLEHGAGAQARRAAAEQEAKAKGFGGLLRRAA